MSRSPRRVLAAAACASLVLLQGPAVAAPMSTSVSDPKADQNPGEAWEKYPGLRRSADLRRAVFSTSGGTLTLAFTFADFPTHKRAYQVVSMSGQLRTKQMTFSGWRHDGEVWTAVSSGLGDESKYYCKGKGSVSLKPKKKRVVMKFPVSCLPRGKVVKDPYPATYVTVLRKNGIAKYVGSDSAGAAPNFAIRG